MDKKIEGIVNMARTDNDLEKIINMTQEIHDTVRFTAERNIEDPRIPYVSYIGIYDEISYILVSGEEKTAARIVMSYPNAIETHKNDDHLDDLNYLYSAFISPGLEIRAYTREQATAGGYFKDIHIAHIIRMTKNLRELSAEFNRNYFSVRQDIGLVCIDVTASKYRNSYILLGGTKTAASIILGMPEAREEYVQDDETGHNYRYSALAAPGVIVNAYTTEPVRSEAAANG